MNVELCEAPFDPWEKLAAASASQPTGHCGACAVFVGSLRDHNAGRKVESMELEHYPAMTRRYLAKMLEDASARWDFEDALIRHRIGQVKPGEAIVLVAVWAVHRAPAFDAGRALMEELKRRAPFWKKEFSSGGARWVEGSVDDRAPSPLRI